METTKKNTEKLKIWEEFPDWETAEESWDRKSEEAAKKYPLKKLTKMPIMAGITPETARFLSWKGLRWLIVNDKRLSILRNYFKHPIKYGWGLIKSFLKDKPYKRTGDCFLYGLESLVDFETKLKDHSTSILVLGFSYCHKPFECPSGRFTSECCNDLSNDVCRQCFIGKCLQALPGDSTLPLIIPTIHYIGEKIFDIVHNNPSKEIIFIITACEMTLEMFGDFGNMVRIKGVGIRLDGRICNTMKAFELSERGIKPGLTVVLDATQKLLLKWIRMRREALEK